MMVVGIVIGLLIGTPAGILIASLCHAASWEDERRVE